MSFFTLQIQSGGPVLNAMIGISVPRAEILQKLGRAIPPAIPVHALVDTGASGSCIDPLVVRQLNLSPKGQIPVHTPSTGTVPHMADQYDVSLGIPPASANQSAHIIPVLAVTCHDFSAQGIQALIGRDILKDCFLAYNGTLGYFTLAF